jgi:hypothetical protein
MTADQLPLALYDWARRHSYEEHDWRSAETIKGTRYIAEEDVWIVGDTTLSPIALDLPDTTNSRYYVGVDDDPRTEVPTAYWQAVPTG